MDPEDRGLQAERTALAWDRTSLALVANAALLIRAGGQGPAVARVAGFVLLAVAGCGLVVGRRRYVAGRAGGPGPVPTAPVVAAGIATVVTCLVALGVVVALAVR